MLLALALVLIAVGLSVYLSLGLHKSLAIAAGRCSPVRGMGQPCAMHPVCLAQSLDSQLIVSLSALARH